MLRIKTLIIILLLLLLPQLSEAEDSSTKASTRIERVSADGKVKVSVDFDSAANCGGCRVEVNYLEEDVSNTCANVVLSPDLRILGWKIDEEMSKPKSNPAFIDQHPSDRGLWPSMLVYSSNPGKHFIDVNCEYESGGKKHAQTLRVPVCPRSAWWTIFLGSVLGIFLTEWTMRLMTKTKQPAQEVQDVQDPSGNIYAQMFVCLMVTVAVVNDYNLPAPSLPSKDFVGGLWFGMVTNPLTKGLIKAIAK